MIRTAVRARRAASAAGASLVLVAGLGACSMGSGPDDDDEGSPGGASPTTGISTTATLGKVTGKLDRDHRAPLRQQVTRAFDSWVDGAFLSGKDGDGFATSRSRSRPGRPGLRCSSAPRPSARGVPHPG